MVVVGVVTVSWGQTGVEMGVLHHWAWGPPGGSGGWPGCRQAVPNAPGAGGGREMPKGGRGPACPGGRREGKVQYSGVGAGKMACPCGPTAGAAQPTVGTASGTEATGEESTVRAVCLSSGCCLSLPSQSIRASSREGGD